jgi:hypothetical protein
MSCNNGHRFVSRHLSFILLFVVGLSVERPFSDQWQGNGLQHFSEQSSAFFTDLVLALKGAALPGFKVEVGVAHEFSPVLEVGERAGLSQQSGQVFVRDYLRGRWRDIGIFFPQPVQNDHHLFGNFFLFVGLLEIIGQEIVEVHLQNLNLASRYLVQGRADRIIPKTLKRFFPDTRCLSSHFPAEELIAILDDAIRVASILLNQGQAGVAVEKVLLERIITKQLDHYLGDPVTQTGDGYITFIVNFVELPEHQVIFTYQPEANNLIQLAQSADDPGIFFVGFVAVVALHHPEFGNRFGIDIAGKKSQSAGGPEQAVLVLTGRFADNAQGFSAMLLGNVVIRTQSFFDNRSSVVALIGIFPAIDFKEKTQGVFVDVHRDIDNIIVVDFLGSLDNLNNGFSFLVIDSTGYEPSNSYCTSSLEGEAFLLAA